MEYERKSVTINWNIENFKRILDERMVLYSPAIFLDNMDGTRWRLGIVTTSYLQSTFCTFWLMVIREKDRGPDEFGLYYEISLKTTTEHQTEPRTNLFTFRKGRKGKKNEICSKTISIRGENDSDSATIRLKMWRIQGSISFNREFFVQTPIKLKHYVFVGVFKNFSQLCVGEKKSLKPAPSSSGKELFKVYLKSSYKPEQTYLHIEINPLRKKTELIFDFQAFLLDSSGKKTDFWKLKMEIFLRHSSEGIPLPFTKQDVMEKAVLYLPNDTLSLHCEATLYYDKRRKIIKREEPGPSGVDKEKVKHLSRTLKVLTSKQGIPCDTKIQTATETVSAHTQVLSAQSPVFEAIFRSNMEEAIHKCVRIDDVDAETVKRMLVFLYSNTLKELEWKDLMNLYIAANKYQILSLKRETATLLKQKIDLSNCMVLLHVADMYQDPDLKRNVQDYIVLNIEKLLHCDQWLDLEKKLPHLAIEILREALQNCLQPTTYIRGKQRYFIPE